MATFTYEGRDKFGIKKTGTITAESIEEAEDILKNQGFVDVKIKLKSTKEKEKSKGGGTSVFKKKAKEEDLAIFTRQLGAMIGAGIGIAQALEILSEQMPNPSLKEALVKVKDDVVTGMSLSKVTFSISINPG